jgi:large subunit ribosomal protein L13
VQTYTAKASEIQHEWYVVDAAGRNLGRLASKVASILQGKHKPMYSPGMDVGDFVIVINADKVAVTGKKLSQKIYYRHSLYPGGLKQVTLQRLLETHPTQAIEFAIKGMLPKNRLGRAIIKKLKVYAGGAHPHVAQKPKPLDV